MLEGMEGFREVLPPGFPTLEGFSWFQGNSTDSWGSTFREWRLLNRATAEIGGSIRERGRYGEFSYRVTSGSYLYNHDQTPIGAAHRLISRVSGDGRQNYCCALCSEYRVDVQPVWVRARSRFCCSECFARSGFANCAMCDRMTAPLSATLSSGAVCSECYV